MELGAVFWECPEEGWLFFLQWLPDYLFRLAFPVHLLLGLHNIDNSLLDDTLVCSLALAGHWRSETVQT